MTIAKVGNGKGKDVVGEYGSRERNEREETLIERARTYNRVTRNPWFRQHPRKFAARHSLDQKTLNQIDYILINKR